MKVVAVSIWVFINLTVLGLFTYLYILWSHYWKIASSPKPYVAPIRTNNSFRWLPSQVALWHGPLVNPYGKIKHLWDEDLQKKEVPTDKLEAKIETYKNQLTVQLRQSQMDAGNVLYGKEENRYDVNYQGSRAIHYDKPNTLLCAFRKEVKLAFLNATSEPFRKEGLAKLFPVNPPTGIRTDYNTCAIVSSAGSLYKSKLGEDIDANDAVLRFNSAPTEGHNADVGRKTTFRIINSQIVSKPQFDFFDSPLYRNVTLMVWDPANYTVDMNQWFHHPEFNVFEPYFKRRKMLPDEKFYLFHPQVLWDTWNFIQKNTAVPILRNPPSSGFLGLAFLLHRCNWVSVYEYIPSMRLTKRCHYFDVKDDPGCTFGDWHPIASEKLLSLAMNTASEMEVYHKGFIRIRGFPNLHCP